MDDVEKENENPGQIKEFIVSKEELEDARDAIIAHAKKWQRTDGEACAVFDELLGQLLAQFAEVLDLE